MQSVGYTAAPFFVIAVVWFVVFGVALSCICLCYCCCRREPYGYSRIAYAFCLIFLILFTLLAMYFSCFLCTKHIHLCFMLHYMIVWISNLLTSSMFCLTISVLDALFCTLVRGSSIAVQPTHSIMLWIRQIPLLKTSRMCLAILLQLRGLVWILFFCHQMSRRTSTILKKRSILLLPLFLRLLLIIQRVYKMSWIVCKSKLLQLFWYINCYKWGRGDWTMIPLLSMPLSYNFFWCFKFFWITFIC